MEVVPQSTLDRIQYGFAGGLIAGALLLAFAAWRGRPPELVAAGTMLLLLLLGTNLYAWYLIPVFALLAMRIDRLGFGYIVLATALGLAYYPMYVYAHFTTDWNRFHVHLFLSLFLTLPIVIYLTLRMIDLARSRRQVRA
jgi:hypothetical protein